MADKTYQGKIITPVTTSQSNNGKTFLTFSLQIPNKIIECIIWVHLLESEDELFLLSSDKSLNKSITIKGFWGKKNAASVFKDKDLQFVIKWFSFVAEAHKQPNLSKEEILIKQYGSIEKAKEAFKEIMADKERQGLILAYVDDGIKDLKPVKLCVEYNNRVYYQVYFCQLILGDEFINEKYKDFLKDKSMFSDSKKGNMYCTKSPEFVNAYKKFLSNILDNAIEKAEAAHIQTNDMSTLTPLILSDSQ